MTNHKFVYDNWKWVLIFTVIYFLWAVSNEIHHPLNKN
jgi:hypothetical protein